MNQVKNIIIIGAGVSGLSAGIYAEQHGFHAILLSNVPSLVPVNQWMQPSR